MRMPGSCLRPGLDPTCSAMLRSVPGYGEVDAGAAAAHVTRASLNGVMGPSISPWPRAQHVGATAGRDEESGSTRSPACCHVAIKTLRRRRRWLSAEFGLEEIGG